MRASRCAKTEVGTRAAREEQTKALRTGEPVGLLRRAAEIVAGAVDVVVDASSRANTAEAYGYAMDTDGRVLKEKVPAPEAAAKYGLWGVRGVEVVVTAPQGVMPVV